MSRFKYAAPLLAVATDLPIFKEMAETGVAKPMRVGIYMAVHASIKTKHPNDPLVLSRARRALRILSQSRRYLAACMEDGAMRYSADGTPFSPVTDKQKTYAKALNQRIGERCGRKETAS